MKQNLSAPLRRDLVFVLSLLAFAALAQPKPGQPAEAEGPQPRPPRHEGQAGGPAKYSIEQATSDRAQLNTIAFDGLAFLTGNFCGDTFLPPGKVSDFFGFQYMRDVDAAHLGHNTSFLTRIANNTLRIFNEEQKAQLVELAQEQEGRIRQLALNRLPMIKAFRRNLEGDLPDNTRGLSRAAVMKYSAGLFEQSGELAFERAQALGKIARSLSEPQKGQLALLKFGDSRTWPEVEESFDRRSVSHGVHVAVMTYASEFFSWYAGSLQADTYFCPEGHGTYFGAFYMKDAPAMHQKNYSISTSLTGDSGEAFLKLLTPAQREQIAGIPDLQRAELQDIVKTRQAIATELRQLLSGDSADKKKVLALCRHYGELDGTLSFYYATRFAEVNRTLTAEQRSALARLRGLSAYECRGAFVYSEPVELPKLASTDFFFAATE